MYNKIPPYQITIKMTVSSHTRGSVANVASDAFDFILTVPENAEITKAKKYNAGTTIKIINGSKIFSRTVLR